MHKDGWPRWWCDSCRGALTLKQACGGLEREVMPISHSYTLSWLEPLSSDTLICRSFTKKWEGTNSMEVVLV